MAAVVIACVATMSAVIALPLLLPEPAGTRALRETAGAIERSAGREKSVTGAVMELSRLLNVSGHGPAAREVIRDHDENMESLRKSAEKIADIGNPYENNGLVAMVVFLVAIQGCVIFAFILITIVRAEDKAVIMSRRSDNAAAVKRLPDVKPVRKEPLSMVRINGRLKN